MTKNTYIDLNAELNLWAEDGSLQLGKDKEAAREYFFQHVNQNTVFFHSLEEKTDHLIEAGLWDESIVLRYGRDGLKTLMKKAYGHKFRFNTFMGAYKFYTSYALKTSDRKRYFERFEDRVVLTAIHYSEDIEHAAGVVDTIMSGLFQPATPTFLNAGLSDYGKPVSCFELRVEDNMESISRVVQDSLQLSKRGGGVGILLTNLREQGAPIKAIEDQASGVIPVMKLLEDAFSYANQLGARQGAGVVYLNAHHMDIMSFLDTKRENADEKIRIKTLSLGVVIPDVAFEIAKAGEKMALFSPYDVEKFYGKPFADISVTEMYDELVENDEIRKDYIDAREFFSTLAEIQFESGYPYILFEDAANRANPAPNVGRIVTSNLCVTGDTEILTAKGYRRADDLWETQEDFEVIVDERARAMSLNNPGTSVQKSSKMFKTATDADVYRVTTVEGHEIKATEWHKFYVEREGEIEKIPLIEITPGERLLARDKNLWATVQSIEFYGVEDVYDPTVENGHSVIYNGLVTGQCSEIMQPQRASTYNADNSFKVVGQDVSCNLGSLNVARMRKLGQFDFEEAVSAAYRFLHQVSVQTTIESSPSVIEGNLSTRAIGLGQMNLHGWLIEEGIDYDTDQARDMFDAYMHDITYALLKASSAKAKSEGGYKEWEQGRWPEIVGDHRRYAIHHSSRLRLHGSVYPQRELKGMWSELFMDVTNYGLANQHLQAIPPTGSISYINHSTASIHPITSAIEIRKEGKLGRVYYPQYGVTNENVRDIRDAYELGPNAVIDMYAVAGRWVDQGMSMTLFFMDTATTRDINKAQIRAHKAGLKSIYYIRIRQLALEGAEIDGCVGCML